MGKSLDEVFTEELNSSTIMHMIRLSDGKVTSIDAKSFYFVLHWGNTYDDGKGNIIIEGPNYKVAKEQFFKFERKEYTKPETFMNVKFGAGLLRFTLNFDAATLDVKELAMTEYGGYDLPRYNPLYHGRPVRYTYMMQLFHWTEWNESNSFPIVKYDDKTGNITAKWEVNSTMTQEPRFIPNPTSKDEDDGLLITMAYNFMEEKTSVFIIDPKTMTTLQQYPLPFHLPWCFHSNYFNSADLLRASEAQQKVKEEFTFLQ